MGLSYNLIDKYGPFYVYVIHKEKGWEWTCEICFWDIKEIIGTPRCEVIWSYADKEDLEHSKLYRAEMSYSRKRNYFLLSENESNLIIHSNLPIEKEDILVIVNDNVYELDNNPLHSLSIKYYSIYCIHINYSLKEIYSSYIFFKKGYDTTYFTKIEY